MIKANAKYVKSFVEVYPNYSSHVTKIAPRTRGGLNSMKFILFYKEYHRSLFYLKEKKC